MSLNGGGGCTSAFPSPLVSAAGALVLFGSSAYASLFLSSSLARRSDRNNGDIGRLSSNNEVTKAQKKEPQVSDVEDLGISSCGGEGGSMGCNDKTRRLPDYGSTPVEVDKIKLAKVKRYRRRDLDGRTLVDQTLTEMENDAVFQETARRLKEKDGAKKMSLEERKNRRRALDKLGVPNFKLFVAQKRRKDGDSSASADGVISRKVAEVLQLNIGLYCNQACNHCHVESSPKRVNEMMSEEVAARCLELLANSPEVKTLDLTGGAPELNRSFRFLVEGARRLRPDPADLDIIDRCNLTVLHEPGQGDLVDFLVKHRVHVVASLPCYSAKNVNTQRGGGVFDRSISALLMLNEAGYGTGSCPDLQLDLVYNPLGAFLPPPQGKLKEQYKLRLEDDFGVTFDELYTMTNMPIKRFADFLHKRNELEDYMDLLVRNFNLDTVENLMCRNTVSVGYDGKIFDCDFNQQLGLSLGANGKMHQPGGMTVFDIEKLADLRKYAIYTDNHCFGCTAGMGSS